MAQIVINDLLDEFREENKRLLNDLQNYRKCYEIVVKYRKCLLDLNNNCICDQNIETKTKLNELEIEFKSVFNRNEIKSELNAKQTNAKNISINQNHCNEYSDDLTEDNWSNGSDEELGIKSYERKKRNPRQRFHSNGCDVSYGRKRGLEDQIKSELNVSQHSIHESSGQYNCEERDCRLSFRLKRSLKEHRIAEHAINGRIYGCYWPGCESRFKTKAELSQHELIHTNVRKFKCNSCEKTFVRNSNLCIHKRHHTKPFRCEWSGCEYRFRDRILLTNHMNKHRNFRPFECRFSECNKRYVSQRDLKDHQKRHYSDSSALAFKCSYTDCPFETRTQSYLKVHELRHKKTFEFKCDQSGCHKSFVIQKELKRHIVSAHTNVRPHQCDWPGCEARFKATTPLKYHKLIHTNVRQFKCDSIGCQMSFLTNAQLLRHRQRTHVKPFRCLWPECDESFGERRQLNTHMNRHQDLRPFKCNYKDCRKGFNSKSDLTQHLRTHKL